MKGWRLQGGAPDPRMPGWGRQHVPPPDAPHGWVQWKGTDVCMDVYCRCGKHVHVDADFAYYVRCPHCGTVYQVNGYVELVPLTAEEAATNQLNVVEADPDQD